ncbi:MAG: acetyl-CoA C-acyltransferase [Ferruginibacter sp.]
MYGVDAMGVTAENLAEKFNPSREEQDLFAYQSQMKAKKATQSGRLAEEIMPGEITSKKGEVSLFAHDELMKPATTLEELSKLKVSFKKENGTFTAGNASGLNDGAAALLIVSEAALKKYNLTTRAKIICSAMVGCEPCMMSVGPVEATKKALTKAGLTLNEIGIIESNETFAAQSTACIKELGLKPHDTRINVNGVAIALGHPLGMSDARIIYSAALELQKQNKKYALATMYIGVGQGYAMVIEKM